MNLNKRNCTPPPNPVLELVALQVKVLLTEYLQTMMQVSFILQQMQMLQMQLAPNPKAKKRKEVPEKAERQGPCQQSMTTVNNHIQQEQEDATPTANTLNENPESTGSSTKCTKSKLASTDQLTTERTKPFMRMRMLPDTNLNLNELNWTETVYEYKANFHLWSKPVSIHEKVNQIEAVWAKRLFLDNNKSVCEQKLYK